MKLKWNRGDFGTMRADIGGQIYVVADNHGWCMRTPDDYVADSGSTPNDAGEDANIEAAELWLAEHVLAPLLPLRSLLPVPEGCVRVRAAVAMCGPDGWDVYGDSDEDDAAIEGGTSAWIDGWRLAGYITADVPIPTTPEIQAEVE